jgi:hypothetical protein
MAFEPQMHDVQENRRRQAFLGVLALIGGVAFVAVAGLFSGKTLAGSPLRIIALLALIVTFFFVLRRPLLGIAIAAFSDVTFYYISGLTKFPPRVYLAVLVTLLSLDKIIYVLRTQTWLRRMFFIALSVTVLIILVDTAHGNTSVLRRSLARRIAPILIMLCVCANVRTVRDLKLLLLFLLGGSIFSAIVGILQYHGFEFAWDLRLNLDQFTHTGDLGHGPGDLDDPRKGRILGMSGNVIYFSYHMVVAAAFLIPMMFAEGLRRRTLWLCRIGALIVVVALVESLTRSAILALWVMVITVTMPIMSQSLKRRGGIVRSLVPVILAVITIYVAFSTLSESSQSDRIFSLRDVNRPTLFMGTLRMIAEHPLGLGTSGTIHWALAHFGDFSDLPNAIILTKTTSHNYFLNVASFWGILTGFLSVLFFVVIWKSGNFLERFKEGLPHSVRWMPIASKALVLGYICQCSFHNAGPFFADLTFWYYVSILLAAQTLITPTLRPLPSAFSSLSKGPATRNDSL